MKIKGLFVIPLIAILIAVFTIGATPGVAADTSASDTLTYVPTTLPPTSSLEEEVEGMVSNLFGDDLQNAEGPIRGFSEIMANLLASFKNILNTIISIFQLGGGMLGEGGILGDSGLLSDGIF